jgi:uncharacterized protein DUF6978/uncharacterized protein DUF1829/uncharacterized protein DUF1828
MTLPNCDLTQKEADRLLKIEKCRIDPTPYQFPIQGQTLRIPLRSKLGNEEFSLDLYRGMIAMGKNMFQTRARKTVILARLDLGGPAHRNPDGKEIDCPHLHLYREGYDDKWAYSLDDQWVQITTPFLDRHNDYLQIYAKKENQGYLLTDDGYILNDLMNSGCDLKSNKRQELLKIIINGFGVEVHDDRLTIHASTSDFGLKKHNLIQAMLSVNDLFYLSSSNVKYIFYEDVTNWFNSSHVRYISRIKFTGKSGLDHMFDFAIPKSEKYPERLVQTINHPTKDAMQIAVFKWLDTREDRPQDTKLLILLNDAKSVNPVLIEAFHNYELETVLWSKREKSRELFIA